MRKFQEIVLFSYDGDNAFSGEYLNSINVRRRVNGMLTVYLECWNLEFTARECWTKNIRSPERFVKGYQDCLDFGVELGDIGIYELFHKGLSRLRKLDAGFAEKVKQYLFDKYGEDHFGVCEEEEPEEASGTPDTSGKKTQKSYLTVRRLTPLEAVRKFGNSLVFVGGPANRSKKK